MADMIEPDFLDFLEKGALLEEELLEDIKARLPSNMSSQIPSVPAPSRSSGASKTQPRAPQATASTPPQYLTLVNGVLQPPKGGFAAPVDVEAAARKAAARSRQAGRRELAAVDARSVAALEQLEDAVEDMRVRAAPLPATPAFASSVMCTRGPDVQHNAHWLVVHIQQGRPGSSVPASVRPR
jgi:hypothetical protein